jgi:tRNA-specific 2-thiouridylase
MFSPEEGRIVVGMSGGVDSSVAALLLVESGQETVGITLRTAPWADPREPARRFGACCTPETAGGARAVARQLGIPYYLLNHEREFAETVIADFIREYAGGRTPSPCVVCNRDVKFGTLLRRALAWGANGVATGHYARLRRDPVSGRYLLRVARDLAKDQSYFLWPLTQAQLARARFPLGDLTKPEVRALARARGLATADTAESQELCFVPGDYREVLRARAPEAFRAGPIVDETGRRLGGHEGLGGYTIGQRRGLGLGGGPPRYVVSLDAARNALVVGGRERLLAGRLWAESVNWIALPPPREALRAAVRIRHAAPRVGATVEPEGPAAACVVFDAPQRAPTPGQSVVFYADDLVLGGGVIARTA